MVFAGISSSLASIAAVSIEVASVGRGATETDGVAEIKFKNLSKTKAEIPFYASFGKGGTEKNARSFVNLSNREYSFNEGGAFGAFKYRWSRPGKPEVVGSYVSGNNALVLAALASEHVFIPITCPKEPGTYNLNLTFDNRPLEAVWKTYNASQSGERCVYFSATTDSMFKIVANKHTH